MTDLRAANEAIQLLRKMGFRVGIDDFGAGAATVDYLRNLQVDFVKVDGGLIQRLGQSEKETALLKGVIQSCTEMGVETIAEWIDTHDKFKRCSEMGFRLGQGRFFGNALKELPRVARAH
jgi:EAL domain-containing protein (putative c-di-GMP-specific phosphodiesterase class I)